MLSQLRLGPVPLRRLHKGTVRALEVRGLVQCRPSRGVLREVMVEITPAGVLQRADR